MSKVYRVYVEKRNDFKVEALEVLHNIKNQLKIDALEDLSIVHRYDVQNVDEEVLKQGISIILSEPMVDDVMLEDYPTDGKKVFAIEYLPGQYDQRADACEQCFQLLSGKKSVKVKCAKLIVLTGNITDEEVLKIREQYVYMSVSELYEFYKDKCSLSGFKKIVQGTTFKHLPIYSKSMKK